MEENISRNRDTFERLSVIKYLFSFLMLFAFSAQAETYLVVPAGPGGLLSRIALAIQEPLAKELNDNVVIEYKPGAQGLIGYNHLSSMTGRAFMLSAPQTWMTDAKDFHAVHYFGTITGIVVAKSGSKFKTMSDAVQGHASYGVPGNSANVGLFREISTKYANSKMVEVPFKSGPEIITNVLGGHVDIGVTTVDGALPFIQEGKLVPLGIFAYTQSDLLKGVKTLKEQGYKVDGEEKYFNNIFLYSNRDEALQVPKLDGMDIQRPSAIAPKTLLQKLLR